MNVDDARHLLTRSGFGAAPCEIASLLPLEREAAVDYLIAGLTAADLTPPPAFVREPMSDYLLRIGSYAPPAMTGGIDVPDVTGEEAECLTFLGMQEMAQLRVWWLDQMISTRSPLAERLALFWHNHFTTQYFDVLTPRLLFDQLQTLRTVGIDNFGTLLTRIMRDPAMLIYLDNALNTRESPNENFAREMLELFTLGIGNYTQTDIRELARTFAGHSVDFGASWAYLVREKDRDHGVKHVLGHTGAFDLDDAARILLDHPRTARFVAVKFYREFISPELDRHEVERLAAVLVGGGYAMRPFLRALLTGDAFWSAANRGQVVKSPIALLVGFIRSFAVRLPDGEALATYAAMLGQELFEPPSVQGWKGGLNWLDPQSIALREQMIGRLWSARRAGMDYFGGGAGDLVLRYSAQTDGREPAVFTLRVNGDEVYRGIAQAAGEARTDGRVGPKPAWEIARVARDRLPAGIDTVEVVFLKQGEFPRLFVNWIEVDGRRWPVHLATLRNASDRQGGVPIGMLFNSGTLHFDIARLNGRPAPSDPSLMDRKQPPNSIIEYATARLATMARPAGEAGPVPASAARGFAELPQGTSPAHYALATPEQRRPLSDTADADDTLRRLTLDPAYNLA